MPLPNINQDNQLICIRDEVEVEPDDLCRFCNCDKICGQCIQSRRLSYSIVTQREDQKHLISPKER